MPIDQTTLSKPNSVSDVGADAADTWEQADDKIDAAIDRVNQISTVLGAQPEGAKASVTERLNSHSGLYSSRVPGRWYTAPHKCHYEPTVTVAANQLNILPFPVESQDQFDQIGVKVQTAAAGMVRVGLYVDNGGGLPGALYLDAGEVSTATTGEKTFSIAAGKQSFTQQKFHLVAIYSGTPGVLGLGIFEIIPLYGSDGCGSTSRPSLYKAQAYGPLPDPCPSGMLYGWYDQPATYLRAKV
ncbi:MAG: hypothetical protein M1548_05785 [Actinobacteria bacterium]|nr:hypothetical protein [Actinomycetota bacterium]